MAVLPVAEAPEEVKPETVVEEEDKPEIEV